MTQTIEQTNGHRAGVNLPPTSPSGATSPAGDGRVKVIPDNTKVDVDLAHRMMIEDWAGWYYPGLAPKDRPSLDVLLAEMIELAHGIGATDEQRPETPAERSARLKRRGQS